jgi:DNA-binding NtrC family response regulator
MGHIRIPALRERKEDILPLAFRFAKRASLRRGQNFGGFTPDAERFLRSYPWPGNVRQLKNAMERLVLMQGADQADLDDLGFIRNGLSRESAMAVSVDRRGIQASGRTARSRRAQPSDHPHGPRKALRATGHGPPPISGFHGGSWRAG